MRIVVTHLKEDQPAHLADVETVDGPGTVLLVGAPRSISPHAIQHQVKSSTDAALRRSADAVVLRMHEPEASQLQKDSRAIENLRGRFSGADIFVLRAANGAHHLDSLSGIPTSGLTEHHIDALRQADFEAFLELPGVVYPQNPDFHYEGPSGHRFSAFVRAASAFAELDALDVLAFWLQPFIHDDPAVLLDSPTITSVGLNLRRYGEICGSSTLAVGGIDCIGSYSEEDHSIKSRLSRLHTRPDATFPPLLFLSSVVSTGELVRRVERIARDFGVTEFRSVGIFGAPVSPEAVFCRTPTIGQRWLPNERRLTTPTVRICKSTFMPELSVQPKLTKVTRVIAQEARRFFGLYRGSDCISVHRHQEGGGRHHMIHLDATRILHHPAFESKLDLVIDQIRDVDAIICPTHRAAREFAAIVSDEIKVSVIAADEDQISDLADDQRQRLESARRILIVDDALVSGARLLGYRQSLRENRFLDRDSDEPPSVELLVAVARPASYEAMQGVADMVNRFYSVERVLLPNWGEDECPWCEEQRTLERFAAAAIANKGSVPNGIKKRLELLRSTHDGLASELFLSTTYEWKAKDRDPWQLGPTSIFDREGADRHPMSQSEIFGAVASGIQGLRAGNLLRERHAFPLLSALDPAFWLMGRFYDPALTASILRATRRHDIRAAELDRDLALGLRNRLTSEGFEDLHGELLFAVSRGHLPMPSHDHLVQALFGTSTDTDICDVLAELLGAVD